MLNAVAGAIDILLLFPLELSLLLLPGFALATYVSCRREIRQAHFITLVLITTGTLGYVSFWAFFASKQLGKFVSFATLICAIIWLSYALVRSKRTRTAVR